MHYGIVIAIGFCLISLIAFTAFGIDKRRAVRHRYRISEAALLALSFFGGIGGLLGMYIFHHKTRKWRFRILVPLFAAMDAMILFWLLRAPV